MNMAQMYTCNECGKNFGLKCSLTAHLRTHSGLKPFQCPTCSRCFTQSGHLKEHIRTHTGERPYQCATCGKAFVNGSRLRVHMRTHLPRTHRNRPQDFPPLHNCSTCQKGFNHINSLKTHQATHDSNKSSLVKKRQSQVAKRFSCDLCGAAFGAKRTLKTHLITHSGHKPHVCTLCSKGFTQSSHLSNHLLTHNAPTGHSCKVCGVKCKSATDMKKHLQSHKNNGNGVTGASSSVVYKCTVCSVNYHKLERLKTHMQRHTGEKVFKCGICSRSFGESAMLVSHMRTHSGERPFECNICCKKFAQRSVLRCHLKMHAGDKRYVCDVCDKRFITQSDVVKHSRVHTKEKPFACQFCNSCFSRSNHLSRHVKIHFRSKKTTQQTDTVDCVQSNAIDNLYPDSQAINPPPVQGTGTFLKVNNLYGYFENIERSSMKAIHSNDTLEQNKFVQQEENFMNFQGTLGLEEEHRLNHYPMENHRDGEVLKYNFEIYDSPKFQYEPNNEIRNQYQKNGGDASVYGQMQNIPVQRMERVVVPTDDARIKLNCRWKYPNTGAHLKNSCKEVSNKTMDNSKPWQCGICDASFKEQDQLKEHINDHKSVMPSVKYTKLVRNPDTGNLEEKDVIPRLKPKLVSKDVVEPIINAHFNKDKLTDPPILTMEDQSVIDNHIENNQCEEVREYTDWTHEQQNYRDTVIIERQEYFKECQEKETTVSYERSQVIMDIQNYKDNETIDETNHTYAHTEYLHENNHNEIHIPDALDPTTNYVYEQDNSTIGHSISCQNILDIRPYKTNTNGLTSIDESTIYTNEQREYLQINDCPESNVHTDIEHSINYVYEQENNIVNQTVSHIHQEENVHIADDIGQPIEYVYEHKKGFIAQKMSLLRNENIHINNQINEAVHFDYHKDIIPHDKNILINNDGNETTNYIGNDVNDTCNYIGNDVHEATNYIDSDVHQTSNYIRNNDVCENASYIANNVDAATNYIRSEVHETSIYIANNVDETNYISSDVDTTTNYIMNDVNETSNYIANGVDETNYVENDVNEASNYMPNNVGETTDYIMNNVDGATDYIRNDVNETSKYINNGVDETTNYISNDVNEPSNYIRSDVNGATNYIINNVDDTSNFIINDVDETTDYIRNDVNETSNFIRNEVLEDSNYVESDVHGSSNFITKNVDETTDYIYNLKNQIINQNIPPDYENMIVNMHETDGQLESDENTLFNINLECQKDGPLVDKINYESGFKRPDEFVISEALHKPVEYLSEDACVDLTCHLKTVDHNVSDEELCQSEFCFLDHSDDQDMLARDKPTIINEVIEDYKFSNGPLLEDSYDNIDSLPTINPATQELQESFPPVAVEEDRDVQAESVIKKCKTKKNDRFACDECPKVFKHSQSLVVHIRSHRGERPYVCTQCPSRFTQPTHLRQHLLSHSDQRNYQCHSCGKAFLKASHLKSHMKLHSNEKEFKCNLCDKSFKHRLGWQLHQNTHGEDTPYKCDICGKGFRHPSTLISHQRTHSGSRPYSCSRCQATFSQLSTLTTHMRTHTDDRPHVCPQCSKGFRSAGDLNRHVQIHSGVRNFACTNPGCSKTFVRKSHLLRHMKTHKIVDNVT